MIKSDEITVNQVGASTFAHEVERLLRKYDDDFVPPLSTRDSTSQQENLDGEPEHTGIDAYLQECLDQNLIIAQHNGDVIGFLSYGTLDSLDGLQEYAPCLYVSTTIIEKEYRNQGVGTLLNEYLFDNMLESFDVKYVVRRTWSTNTASKNYIESLGFREIKRVKDHRQEGIDSLYYAKPVSELL